MLLIPICEAAKGDAHLMTPLANAADAARTPRAAAAAQSAPAAQSVTHFTAQSVT